jgi:hypothetical protein
MTTQVLAAVLVFLTIDSIILGVRLKNLITTPPERYGIWESVPDAVGIVTGTVLIAWAVTTMFSHWQWGDYLALSILTTDVALIITCATVTSRTINRRK